MTDVKLEGDTESRTERPTEFFNRAYLGGFSQILEGIVAVGVITDTPAAVKIHVVINACKKADPDFFCLRGIPEKFSRWLYHKTGAVQ